MATWGGTDGDWIALRRSGATGQGCLLAFGCVVIALVAGVVWAAIALAGRSPQGAVIGVAIALVLAAVGTVVVLAEQGPRPRLWTDRIAVPVGESFAVRWETAGRFRQARSIRITWEGHEVAIRRGYNDRYHDATFATHVVVEEIAALIGRASVPVPQLVMPSFSGDNAMIEWRLRARVETPMWPSVEETYLITVLPANGDEP